MGLGVGVVQKEMLWGREIWFGIGWGLGEIWSVDR